MKALSYRQPWAWLIVRPDLVGEVRAAAIKAGVIKDIENRDWSTKFRGTSIVHASKGMTRDEYEETYEFAEEHGILLPPMKELDRGGIVGLVDIVDCVYQSDSRWFFGDWGFVLANAVPLPFIPWKGELKFFEVPDSALIRPAPPPVFDLLTESLP
jgi:hypothetical protein